LKTGAAPFEVSACFIFQDADECRIQRLIPIQTAREGEAPAEPRLAAWLASREGSSSIMTQEHANEIRKIFDRLFEAFGPQRWWPAETPLEIIVGAILTQNTSWRNVERAIGNLRAAGAMSWTKLRDLPEPELATLIQPSGSFRIKAKRLKAFVNVLWTEHGGMLESLFAGPLNEARLRLLAIHGIGPETADAILLYAAGRASFVVDAYTTRILRRHFLIQSNARYQEIRDMLQVALPNEAQLFNEYHALFVVLGKRFCKRKAECNGCPLADMPHDVAL
jgi:endonuclease-3 related protein